jgi:hypothetical protein
VRTVTPLVLIGALMASCAQPPAPQKFTGPTAYLKTTETPRGENGGDFFYLTKIDGEDFYSQNTPIPKINDGTHDTKITSTVEIPVKSTRFSVRAHTAYPAPIFGITNPVYDISGDITFTPVAGQTYALKGALEPDHSAVWIENTQTGEIVGTKVEANGSAKIDFFRKLVCDPNTCKN